MTTDTMTLCPKDFEIVQLSENGTQATCVECHTTYDVRDGELVESKPQPLPDKLGAKVIPDRPVGEESGVAPQLEALAWLRSLDDDSPILAHNDFLVDVRYQTIVRGKPISEKQAIAVLRNKAKVEVVKTFATPTVAAGVPVIASGNTTFEGVVISAKTKVTQFGESVKILVREDDGNRYWGSFVKSAWKQIGIVHDELYRFDEVCAAIKGKRVRVTAEVEVSNDDAHFGFFHRPRIEVL